MLTHDKIVAAVKKTAPSYPIKSVAYFGSYAEGRQTEESDLDLLVEFHERPISLLVQISFKHEMEDELNIPVDVVATPISKDSILEIERTVHVYG